eukprot:m.44212 g.44212  ORF g.44212 m.44212 type:complete len:311 (+) comp11686_c0_seq2:1801-2733(+)
MVVKCAATTTMTTTTTTTTTTSTTRHHRFHCTPQYPRQSALATATTKQQTITGSRLGPSRLRQVLARSGVAKATSQSPLLRCSSHRHRVYDADSASRSKTKATLPRGPNATRNHIRHLHPDHRHHPQSAQNPALCHCMSKRWSRKEQLRSLWKWRPVPSAIANLPLRGLQSTRPFVARMRPRKGKSLTTRNSESPARTRPSSKRWPRKTTVSTRKRQKPKKATGGQSTSSSLLLFAPPRTLMNTHRHRQPPTQIMSSAPVVDARSMKMQLIVIFHGVPASRSSWAASHRAAKSGSEGMATRRNADAWACA